MTKIYLIYQLYIHGIHVFLTYGCGQSEYQSEKGDCCPKCNIGMVVLRDCFGDYSTTCKPCSSGTFMDHPNGLMQCLQCQSCDSQQGLYVLNPCTTIRDTQCEVLDGFYCKEYKNNVCRSAMKHRQCDPGEAIRTPGNKVSDTVCEVCPSGFYSPLGINCTRWTDCSVKNELQDREGSAVEDVQCLPNAFRLRAGSIVAIILSIVLLTVLYVRHKKSVKSDKTKRTGNVCNQPDHRLTDPIQETGHSSVHAEPSPVHVLSFFKKANKEARSAQP